MKDLHWFKKEFSALISDYRVECKNFKNGDFGDLDRLEFEREDTSGYVDFWSSGWLNIHFINCNNFNDLINVLLSPGETTEKDKAFEKLRRILGQ
ncbi:hypothetical protein [Mucilaginibacter agri]|uniref:Uncharacterized protein n=1 Tax=Mucilaginibacter agri TaxID=2695265 RepID=A0A966DU64_9SPHI|nr:hypothetical protein [Mucilaginibacter agri]NCD71395.1 hypothetical protein [Mucilaginibacter agri]